MIALLVDGAIHAWEAGKNTVRRRSARPPGLHLSYPQPHPQPRDRGAVGLEGCSSHSGRRTFITRAARLVHKAGGSLRDVQLLAGHRSIQTTQRYIDGDTDAQRKLVSLI